MQILDSMEGDGIQDILGSGLTSDENGSAPSLSFASGELQFESNISQQLSDCAVASRHLDITVENHDSGDSKIDKEINKRIDGQDIGEDQSVLRDSIDKYPTGDDGELLENSFEVRSESQEDTFESCEEDETVLGEHTSDAETIDHDGEMKGEGKDDSSDSKTSSQAQTSVLSSEENLLNSLEEPQDGAWMTHDAESSTRTEENVDYLENAQVNSVPTKAVQMKKELHCQTDLAEADTVLDDNGLQVQPFSLEADAVLDDNGLQVQSTSLEADAVLDEKKSQVHPALSEVDTALEKVKPPSYFKLFQTEAVHEKDEHLSLSDSSPSVVLLDDGDLHSQPSSSPTEVVLEKDEPFSHSDSSPGETLFEQDELLSNSDSSPSVVLLDERVPHSQINSSPTEAVAERNQPLSLSSAAAKVVFEKDESLSLSDSSPSVVLLDEGEPCSQSSSSPTETILETFEPLLQRGLQSSDTVLEEEDAAVNTDTASLSSLLDKHEVHSQTGAVLDKGEPLCQSFVEQDEVADRNSFQPSFSMSEGLPEKHRSLLQSHLQPDDIITDEAKSLGYLPVEAVAGKCESHKLCSSPATDITVKTNLPPKECLQSTDATLDREGNVFLSGLPAARDILGKQVPFSQFFYDGLDKSVCSSDSSSSTMDAIVEKNLSQAELSSSGGLQETSSRIQPLQVTFGFETLKGVSVGDSTDHSKELQSGMEAEGKQLCTCSLVEQFNRDWSIRCSQLQNLTPEQYHLVLLEHLQFVKKLINSQPSGHPIPDSIDGENKNTNSSAPGHEGIQPCPLHGFMSQAEGSLLNLYFNHEGILPGSSGLAGGIAGLLDSLGAQAQSSAQEEEELPQGKKLMKLKDRIEKELENLLEKEKYVKKTLRELTTSKTKVEKEWGTYISQLHSRLDKQHHLAKDVFIKKHTSCEKKIKERHAEVCSYQTQLTNLLARVEAALHHDGCPQPSSGFKILKKELTTILSMMPEFQVVAKPSYSLHLPKDASKSLAYIVGLVMSDRKRVSSENVDIIITESEIGSVTELKGRMSKTFQDTRSNTPHSENLMSQYDKSTGPPKDMITSLPENENITPAHSKSFTAVEKESTDELKTINTKVLPESFLLESKITTAKDKNIFSPSHVKNTSSQNKTATKWNNNAVVQEREGTATGISKLHGEHFSVLADRTQHEDCVLVSESSGIVPTWNTNVAIVQNKRTSIVQNRSITAPLSGGTTVPQNCSSAVSESSSFLASQISNITASQSSSTDVSQNSDTLTAPHCKGTAGEVEHAALLSLLVTDHSDKSGLIAETCFTTPDIQASQRPFFVPLTSVFPPVPKLHTAAMRQQSSVPLLNSDRLHSQSLTQQASQTEDDLGPGYQTLEIAGRQTSFGHIFQREDMQNYTACDAGGDFQSKMSASLPTTPTYSPVDDAASLTTPPYTPVLDTGAQSMFSLAGSHLDTTSLQDYSPHHVGSNTFLDSFPQAALGSVSVLDRDRTAQVPFSYAHMSPYLRFSEPSHFISQTNLEDDIQSSWQSSSAHHDDTVRDIIYDSVSLMMGGADTYGGVQSSPCSGDSSVRTQLEAAGFKHNKSLSYAAAAQKTPISVPPGFQSLPQSGQSHAGSEHQFSETLSASAAISVNCKKSARHSRRGKARNSCSSESSQMAASVIPTSIRADNTSFVTFGGSGKVPTSFAPLPNGQVWLAYGFSDEHIELMDEEHMIERIMIGGYTTHVSCLNEERILLLSQSPKPVLQIIDGNHKLTVVRKLQMKVNAVCAGDTGIAVCSSILLLWIPRYRGTEEWLVSKESSCFKEACSCAVMFRDRSEVICVADKGGHAVFFFEKKSRKGAACLTPYTGAGFSQDDQEFTPISVSAHSAGFVGILDSTTQSVLILGSKLQLTSVISRQHLCCGSPSVIAFSADSSCKLWVASEPGPICLASLPLN